MTYRNDDPPDEWWDDSEPAEWVRLTKRTEDPKLSWLEGALNAAGIANRRNGESWHAPIMEVDASKLDDAWAILAPIDDVLDDDGRFV